MKVLLVSTNQLKPAGTATWVPVVPLGLTYVASSLREAGHEVDVLDICFEENETACLTDMLGSFMPGLIGISFRNIEMMTYLLNPSFVDDLREVIETCRRHSRAHIVIGGSGFSVMPVEILEACGPDLGIVGEGEWCLPELVRRLGNSEDYSDVPGLVFRRDGKIHVNPPGRSGDLSGLPLPARDLVDHVPYVRAGGIGNIQTKRGCPFGCIYCTYPLVEGNSVRCRPPVAVAEEFCLLAGGLGIKEAYVVDSQFNHPLDHAKCVCEEIIKRRDEAKIWWRCMLNPGHVDEELVLMLKLARCVMVDLGIDSASEAVLDRLGKNFTVRHIEKAIGLLKTYRLPHNVWVLLGGPGETEDTVVETLEFLAARDVGHVLFGIGLRVCPGTGLERMMKEESMIEPDTNLLESVFYLAVDAGTMVDRVRPFCHRRPGWHIAGLE